MALARLQREWHAKVTLVTQNVDDLHERAGSPGAIQLHGRLDRAACARCDHRWPAPFVMSCSDPCPGCGATASRPAVVWFGELSEHLDQIGQALRRADLFVVIGSSGAVWPADGFVETAAAAGAETLEIKTETSAMSGAFDRTLRGCAAQIVPTWVEAFLAAGRAFMAAPPALIPPRLTRMRQNRGGTTASGVS